MIQTSPVETRQRSSTPDSEVMIDVRNLSKHFGDIKAVDDISFTVHRGEIFSFLGHNGAGKTTTIRMLTGRSRPTSGSATIAGMDIVTQRDDILPIINVVPEDQNLYERLTGRANLELFADLYGAPRQRVDELLERVGLEEASKRATKTYSSGMKQRLLIARALINTPELLFLDEPTRGLDPASAKELRDMINELSQQNTTVFLTTHLMEEADDLSHTVAFISAGKLVAIDSPRELKLRHGERSAAVLLEDRSEQVIDLHDAADARRLQEWMEAGQVLAIHSREGTLEDVFIEIAGRSL
ncbi:MAG: ABC transporter ATP-binding protein [Sphaerobacteraceae bacterium]|nr:MAG: ABC transporter ATP-binding protein [Sphaerobacteraceae bacterium]